MRSQAQQKQIVFFLVGFMIGVLYIYFAGSQDVKETDFLSMQNLMQIMYTDISFHDYFLYLLKKRIGILALLLMISFALHGRYLLLGFLMVFGCSMGSMLSVLIMRYKIKGLLLFVGLVFPQDIIYIPVIFGWVVLMMRWNESYFWGRNIFEKRKYTRSYMVIRTVLLTGVTIIGVLLECYVNPFIVNWCLKIF